MDLLEWSRHDIILTLIKNHNMIAWCTMLTCSNANERINVESPTSADLRLLEKGNVIVCTPLQLKMKAGFWEVVC
ncbi:hypothetical protein BKA62DRAFT_770351 [Auriculariales sp. MPI-PUGE-AT-0066]|nr:hypothetical protein BKA62DRAFT_770351 [Auriculariales sp. MPI-PUGE-AT-0066]